MAFGMGVLTPNRQALATSRLLLELSAGSKSTVTTQVAQKILSGASEAEVRDLADRLDCVSDVDLAYTITAQESQPNDSRSLVLTPKLKPADSPSPLRTGQPAKVPAIWQEQPLKMEKPIEQESWCGPNFAQLLG